MERLERMRLLVAGPSGPKGRRNNMPHMPDDSDSDDHDDDDSSDEEDGGPAARALMRRRGRVAAAGAGSGAAGRGGGIVELPAGGGGAAAKPEASKGGDKAKKAHEDRKRPGKRQRALLKAEGKDPSTGRVFKAKKKREGAAAVPATVRVGAALPASKTVQKQAVEAVTPERAEKGPKGLARLGKSKSAAKPVGQDRPRKEIGGSQQNSDGQKRRKSIS